MKKLLSILFLISFANLTFADPIIDKENCTITIDGETLSFKRINSTEDYPDLTIKIVEDYPDIILYEQINTNENTTYRVEGCSCGYIQITQDYPDLTFKIVEDYPDLTIKIIKL